MATGGSISRRSDGHVVVDGLSDVNLEIESGERVGLVGHNGAGKTTMLRTLAGIYRPTTGTASIDGNVVSLININLGIDPEATGTENIYLRASMMGMSKREVDQQFDEIAKFTGLGDFLDMPLRTYSSGMQLRLAFAISTSISPQILIMDEWLSTGDKEFRERADARLSDIVSKTRILILASHSRGLLEKNCSRVIWLEHGRIKMDGPAKNVIPCYFDNIDDS